MGKEIPKEDVDFTQTPREVYDNLDKYVIGQERAKRTLAIAATNHIKRLRAEAEIEHVPDTISINVPQLKKSNVLLVGPSGCGKTHLARNLAKVLKVPFAVVDATEYTEAGYYGKDVEVMLGELLYSSDLDVNIAQQGIVFIDEIDKVARKNHGARTGAGSRDIGGEGVQQGLLKLLEGTKVFVPLNITQHWSKHDFVELDTTNILFICAGTFTDMKRGMNSRSPGFQKEITEESHVPYEKRVSVEDLMQYGMIAELLGRIPIITELSELTEDQLVRIMKEPPDSILKEYTYLMSLDDIALEFDEAALFEIAKFSRRRKLGARALRSIFEDIMHDIMFEAPERKGENLLITLKDVQDKIR
jgi:ATP-dependent Clp protease ATP-binding subunit ClpX